MTHGLRNPDLMQYLMLHVVMSMIQYIFFLFVNLYQYGTRLTNSSQCDKLGQN